MRVESLLVQIAEREVGTREEGGENCGPRVREYQRATWLEPGPWPWCASMVSWCIREWIAFPETREYLGLGSPSEADRWRPKNPAAFAFERWARDHGQLVMPATEPARAGDLVIFDFSHIGIVIRNESEPGWIETVEGNTNGAGSREGDGVWRKRRPKHLVKCFIRWKRAD